MRLDLSIKNQVQNWSEKCVKDRQTFNGQEGVRSNFIWPLMADFQLKRLKPTTC